MKIETTYETKGDYKQACIKVHSKMCQVVIIVGLDGWEYNSRDSRTPNRWGESSLGKNVRMSMNGPLKLTMDEWNSINLEIEDAYHGLLDAAV